MVIPSSGQIFIVNPRPHTNSYYCWETDRDQLLLHQDSVQCVWPYVGIGDPTELDKEYHAADQVDKTGKVFCEKCFDHL